MNWKTMESAPNDGTEILIRYPLQGNVKQLVSFNKIHGHWTSKGKWVSPVSQGCEWTFLPPDEDLPYDDSKNDADRLIFAMGDLDGFVNVSWDKYDYALHFAQANGRDTPNADDELAGLRALIDAAINTTAQPEVKPLATPKK